MSQITEEWLDAKTQWIVTLFEFSMTNAMT